MGGAQKKKNAKLQAAAAAVAAAEWSQFAKGFAQRISLLLS